MVRSVLSGVLVCVACVWLLADEPKADLSKNPQWQRMLTGEDEKTAEKLAKRLVELEASDDYEGAIQSAEELVRLRVKVQGADHYQVKTVEHYLVRLRKVAALDANARRKWRQVTSRSREARILRERAQYAAALLIEKEILETHRKVLGEEHPDTATSYNNLALNLAAQGKAAEAAPLFQKALAIRRKVLGEEHPHTAASYNNLAYNLKAQGKAAEAGPLLQKALEIFRKVLGEEHPDTAASYGNVASNLNAQGKAADAGPLLQKALEIRRKVLGEEHPSTAASYNNLAYNLKAQGKASEAGPLYQKALNIFRKVLGEEHPDTALSYNNVAYNLQAQGKAAEAGPLYQKALNIFRKVLGEEHPSTATSYDNLAANLQAQGKAAEAGPLFQKALAIKLKVLGEEHPDTATSYSSVAYNLDAQGKATEAAPLHQKALDIFRKVLGEEHPLTATGYTNVAANTLDLGDTQRAITILTQGIRTFESSRLATASGLERGNLTEFNPRRLLACVLASTEPQTAWQQLERSLARGLFDQQSHTSRLTSDEQRRQDEARRRVAALQPRILHLVTRSNRTAAEVQELQELLAQRRQQEETIAGLAVLDSERAVESGERIQAALPADAAILYWVDLEDTTVRVQEHWACVVRNQGEPKFVRLPGTGENQTWAASDLRVPGQLRLALAYSPSASEVEPLAKQLHSQRIAPVLPHLAGVKTLHVVATHAMAGIPIEALTQDFRINYVPSGSYLARLGQQPKVAGQQLLALGDPVYPAAPLPAVVNPLPPGGLLITQVVPGATAAKVGLKSGDVLLAYAGQELTNVDKLKNAIAANENAKTNAITIWREGQAKIATREVPPGKLGVVLDPEPAPQAIAARRKTNEQLAKLSRGGEWAELPGTAAELASLQSLFPQSTILTRNNANPKKLAELVKADKLKDYRYLHFATHGEANSKMAFQSSLILHGDDNSVARLTAREILETWKLNAELVTLSACETAIGKDGGGEGLLGFAQAFLTAGARSVCLSLWKVDDAATALLMERFYQNLLGKRDGLTKPMGKADALHEAKQWLRNLSAEEATARYATLSKGVARGKDAKPLELVLPKTPDAKPQQTKKPFDHPRFWAAFILIGDPN